MSDRKFTDDEVIKALECCTKAGMINCRACPYEASCNMGESKMQAHALALINRQKAEIERLNGCVKTEEEVRTIAKAVIDVGVAIAKAEAIKEFAERLKEKAEYFEDEDYYFYYVTPEDIDNLVKEMTEGGGSDA